MTVKEIFKELPCPSHKCIFHIFNFAKCHICDVFLLTGMEHYLDYEVIDYYAENEHVRIRIADYFESQEYNVRNLLRKLEMPGCTVSFLNCSGIFFGEYYIDSDDIKPYLNFRVKKWYPDKGTVFIQLENIEGEIL